MTDYTMNKYIDSEKLIAEIEYLKGINIKIVCETNKNYCRGYVDAVKDILHTISTLQQEQPDQTECVWIHKKYNREYRVVSDNARLKNSNGEWIDCVIYAPLYENEFEMFAREKDSFYKEFEKK